MMTLNDLYRRLLRAPLSSDPEDTLLSGHDLSYYAASDAARTLVQNWIDTLKDDPDYEADHLVEDLSMVIALLQQWRYPVRKVLLEYTKERTREQPEPHDQAR